MSGEQGQMGDSGRQGDKHNRGERGERGEQGEQHRGSTHSGALRFGGRGLSLSLGGEISWLFSGREILRGGDIISRAVWSELLLGILGNSGGISVGVPLILKSQ